MSMISRARSASMMALTVRFERRLNAGLLFGRQHGRRLLDGSTT
jgi:hypothetical protein